MRRMILGLAAFAALTACGGGQGLRTLDGGTAGPDEFSVLPSRPLVMPLTNALPEPTPGGTNPADPNPTGQAIAALGGVPAAASAGGIPATDAALVAQAGRFGVSPDIRSTLAAEDAAFRGRRSAFSFLGGDRYFRAYAAQALDAYAALDRFRAAGVTTPSAPPAP